MYARKRSTGGSRRRFLCASLPSDWQKFLPASRHFEPTRVSRRSFISIPVIEACAAEGQGQIRASSVRHSCCMPPCDIAPCISSRGGGAGCTSSVVASGGMNEGRAQGSGRALCTSRGRAQNFHSKVLTTFENRF